MNRSQAVEQAVARSPGVPQPGDLSGVCSQLLNEAIETVDLGIILVATDGWILYANRMALELMRCSRGVRSSCGWMVVSTPGGDARLADLAKPGSATMVGTAVRTPIIALQCGEGARHLFAHIAPGHKPGGGAAMFIVDPENYAVSRLDVFASRYGLTSAEARVLNEIISGRGLVAASRNLGIAESTARTHLRRVFEKTGTSRQTELLHFYLTGVASDCA